MCILSYMFVNQYLSIIPDLWDVIDNILVVASRASWTISPSFDFIVHEVESLNTIQARIRVF